MRIDPVISLKGDKETSSRYIAFAKQRVDVLLDSIEESIFSKYYPIVSFNKDNNRVIVHVIIKFNLPEVNIIIDTEESTSLSLSGGLSREELNNDPNFDYFYPNGSDLGFQSYPELYVDYEVNDEYQKNYIYPVNQAHYIYGSQFTGEMKNIVQLMLGTRIKINYKSDWDNTDLIYTDSENGKWLINISNNGIYTRKINYSDVSSANLTVQLPDGIPINYDNDIKLLDINFYSDSFTINNQLGWATNSKGNEIQNTCFKLVGGTFKIKTERYKILINEKERENDDDPIELEATYQLIEDGILILLRNDSFTSPILNNNLLESIPINTNNYTYDMSKVGSHYLLNFGNDNLNNFIDLEDNQEYKCPITVYYDENDIEKVLYYYIKKNDKIKTINSSNPNVEKIEDFYYKDYIPSTLEGYIKELGTLEILNDDYDNTDNTSIDFPYGKNYFNATIKHGFMFNNDESTLYEDNLGDINTNIEVSMNGSNTNDLDNFVDDVENNRLSVNLNPYINFKLNNYLNNSNNKLISINSLLDNFNTFFINTDRFEPSKDFSTFNPKEQGLLINTRLNKLDLDPNNPLLRLNNILQINKIEYKELLQIRDIIFTPYLYQLDNNVVDLFEYFINNYNSYENDLDNCISMLSSINSSYLNIREGFNGLKNYLRNLLNPSDINIDDVNNNIDYLNNTFINPLNTYIQNINDQVDSFNNLFNGVNISNMYENYNKYINLVHEFNNYYLDSLCEDIGLTLQTVDTIVVDQDTPGPAISQNRTENRYFGANLLSQLNVKYNQVISNRKIKNFSLIFHPKDRSSISIFSQEKTFNDLNYYQITINNIFKNISNHFDNCVTNKYRFFVQEIIYTDGNPSYGDILPIDNIEFNVINKTVVDFFGNTHNLEYPLFPDLSSPNQDIYICGLNTNNYPKKQFLLGDLNSIISNDDYNSQLYYSIKDINYNLENNKYESVNNLNLYIYSNNIINNSGNLIIDDARLTYQNSNYNNYLNFMYDKHNNIYEKNGTLFYNFLKDSFSDNYVFSQLSEYGKYQLFLTNITTYSNIFYNENNIENVYPVNFLGIPFF